MIGYLRGELALINESEIIIDVQGVGYKLSVSSMTLSLLPSVGSQIKAYTYFQVREDAVSLYGFLSQEELSMFEQLIGVNSVGPKAALSILGTLSVNDLKFAVLSDDAKSIARSPGIGAKTAQRIIMELKDKISLAEAFQERSSLPASKKNDSDAFASQAASADAIEGLVALGYSASDAMKAVRAVDNIETLDAEAILKAALKKLY